MSEEQKGSLSDYRVLDLTDEKGFLCGRILADLGADVIKVEKPGGNKTRNRGPFYRDLPDSEKSLYWFAYNMNKRGITLDIETREGQEIFRSLTKTADVVVESSPPGYMGGLGLGYNDLAKINPGIIMASITPFGHEGFYKDYKATDMVAMAMGGWMFLCGEPERPPVVIGFPQSYLSAAGDAAIGILIALYFREVSGEGQHIDVCTQQSVVPDTREAIAWWALQNVIQQRSGGFRIGLGKAGVRQRTTWECKDGYIYWYVLGGLAGHSNRAFVEWMDSEGMATDFLRQVDWDSLDPREVESEFWEKMEEAMARFFLSHTKAELYHGALQRDIILYPLSTIGDLLANEQLKARGFWIEVEHSELGEKITYPGPFIKMGETPLQIRRRAPLIGEHNEEVYEGVLGLSKAEMIALKESGVI